MSTLWDLIRGEPKPKEACDHCWHPGKRPLPDCRMGTEYAGQLCCKCDVFEWLEHSSD